MVLTGKTNKIRFLSNAVMIGSIGFCITIGAAQFHDWYHWHYLVNVEANDEFISNSAFSPVQAKLALKFLTDHYKSPNDVRLTELSESMHDSIVGADTLNAYTIGFV